MTYLGCTPGAERCLDANRQNKQMSGATKKASRVDGFRKTPLTGCTLIYVRDHLDRHSYVYYGLCAGCYNYLWATTRIIAYNDLTTNVISGDNLYLLTLPKRENFLFFAKNDGYQKDWEGQSGSPCNA